MLKRGGCNKPPTTIPTNQENEVSQSHDFEQKAKKTLIAFEKWFTKSSRYMLSY